jgi:C-terminal processing protease CtpA/Prc
VSSQKKVLSLSKGAFFPTLETSLSTQELFAKILIIDQLLAEEYVDPDTLSGTQSQRIENALKAYVAGIDDPYTNYLSKEENTQLVQSLRDEIGIEGIGAVVEKKDSYVQIEEVIKN